MAAFFVSKENLSELREAMLFLHKILLDYEKKRYEGKYGKFPNVGAYFNAVTQNPSFAWLRQLSALLVSLDEMLEKLEEQDTKKIKDFLSYAKNLLTVSEGENGFAAEYFTAVQKDPAVGVAHGRVSKILKEI